MAFCGGFVLSLKKENTWYGVLGDSRSHIKYSPIFVQHTPDGQCKDGTSYDTDSAGYPNVFNLERNDDGLWLNNDWAKPDNTWNPDNEFVFRFRNCLLFHNLKGCGFSFLDSPSFSSNHQAFSLSLQVSKPPARNVRLK